MGNASIISEPNSIKEHQFKIIESLLLPPDCIFDDERRDFIFCNDKSIDLVACAGSGKTTALIAKLLLIEKDLPFTDNKGVCILTHTNVAIDQIKNKIGLSSRLFNPPNFFGTIQQFVDKFLAIPSYKTIFGRTPIVDDSFYNAEWDRKFKYLHKKAKQLCKMNPQKNLPYSIRKNYKTGKLTESLNGKELSINIRNISEDDIQIILKSFSDRRDDILKSGILSFYDAYYFAQVHLTTYPFMADVISERFRYVFIDEMQDTAKHQLDILNQVFKDKKTIIQCIGDPNQAIYDFEIDEEVWQPTKDYKSLTRSLRFSGSICRTIKDVRLDNNDELFGNETITDIPPHLILYGPGQESAVINEFIRIILENIDKLELKKNDMVKVIGLNGKDTSAGGNIDNIQKYYRGYLKSVQNKKKYFKHLKTYIELSKQEFFRDQNLKTYRDLVLEIFSRFLYEMEIKIDDRNPTADRIYSRLKTETRFKNALMFFSLRLFLKNTDIAVFERYLINKFLEYWGDNLSLTQRAKNFIESQEIEDFQEDGPEYNSNKCGEIVFEKGDVNIHIPITVSTVHGVKGETHKATLYLETKYHEYDLEEIINHLSGTKMKGGSRATYRQKVVYVGLSRASHLLCLAMRKNGAINNLQHKKALSLFKIVDLSQGVLKPNIVIKNSIVEDIQCEEHEYRGGWP